MRSKHQTLWNDASTRPTDKLTDDKVYGFSGVVGSGVITDLAASDPRDFRGVAGAATNALNGAAMAVVDITRRPTGVGVGVGWAAANPTAYDHGLDRSANADARGFEAAPAGGSVRHTEPSPTLSIARVQADPTADAPL